MDDLLRRFVHEVMREIHDARVPSQLLKKGSKSSETESETEAEMEEMSVVANIAGFTGPLGAGAADMGSKPVKPGRKLKKNKRKFVRWK